MKKFEKILTHIPHSSLANYYKGWIGGFNMFPVVKAYTDWHTDLLFSTKNPNVESMVFPYSRFYLDVERLIDDPLEKIGQGRIYTEFNGFERKVSDTEVLDLERMYFDWWSGCNDKADENTLVIDCHAFTNSIAPDVDVCVGFNDDSSRPDDDMLWFITDSFREMGFNVVCNKPYSNSITFNSRHKSVMIELNKSIYMNEDTLELKISAYKVKNIIEQIYDKLTEDK